MRLFRRSDRVSDRWLADQRRAECRNQFIGVSWNWRRLTGQRDEPRRDLTVTLRIVRDWRAA
jgi:hypothetical protein